MHTSALPFKVNRLRSQATTCTSTFVRSSNQFHSSWRPGPNHTPRMWTGPSLQRKGPGRRTLPLQALNCKPSLLSKLTLAPATFSYLATAYFTANMSQRLKTKTVISSANTEIFARTLLVSKILRRARPSLSSLIQSKDVVKRGQGTAFPDRSLDHKSLRTPPVHLRYSMLIHLWNSDSNPAVSRTAARNRRSTLSKALD